MMPLILDIALTHLRNRKRQSVVSVISVAVGVGFFIAMAAMMQGFQRYFVQKIIDVSPHITMMDDYRSPPVQPVHLMFPEGAISLRGLKPEEELRGIKDAKSTIRELSQLSGVTVAPTLKGQAILRYGSKDVPATLTGIKPELERQVSNLEKDLTAGSLESLYRTSNGVILGVGVAKKLGANVGNTLTAISPAGVVLKMKVVGIFRTDITPKDNFEGYTLLKKSQILQNRPNVINEIRFRLRDIAQAGRLAAEIESRYGYRTESWEETNKNVLGIFVIQNAIMYSTVGAILIVAAFGIYNIISTVIHEKTRDIAILKSIGFQEGDIRKIFLLEGLAVGLIGTLIGWGLGYGLTAVLASVRFEIEGLMKSEGFILYYSFTHYSMAGCFAVLAATTAAYLPARKAAWLNPVDIIRGAA